MVMTEHDIRRTRDREPEGAAAGGVYRPGPGRGTPAELYELSVRFLSDRFSEAIEHGRPDRRIRAFYPEIRLTTSTFELTDTRLSFGHVAEPGVYSATITRPDLFANYLTQQIKLLVQNHGEPVVIDMSQTPIPVHFAVANDAHVSVPQEGAIGVFIAGRVRRPRLVDHT